MVSLAVMYNLAMLHVDRVFVLLEEAGQDAGLRALQEGRECVTCALGVSTQEDMPANHRDAMRLLQGIEQAMRNLGGGSGL